MDVGERLQSIRKLKGLSQRELAKRAGVTNSTISMIEKNSVSPSISSLRKVLGGIPMSMVEFFSEEILQEKPTQIVYKANELIDISDGAVTMKLVGRAHPSRAIAFLNEIYPPGADTGDEMLRSLVGSEMCIRDRAGVTNSTISMIEKNSVSPSISSLRKVLGGIPMSLSLIHI